MSMDTEDGFERGFARGWDAAMARVAQAKREDDLRAAKVDEYRLMEAAQKRQIAKMQDVQAGPGGWVPST